ncbi:MAG: hypothetical protein LIO90_11670 [Bacteroidales bacterium]|nr:hypothetical protein [Bacteroidales bacterium]
MNLNNDPRFREYIKRHAATPRPNPWFTRKVLRSLPPRSQRVARFIETSLYIIGIIICGWLGVKMAMTLITTQEMMMDSSSLSSYLMIIGLFCALLYGLIDAYWQPRTIAEKE